jgi:uncharacterized protein YecA (UPF0149 family)
LIGLKLKPVVALDLVQEQDQTFYGVLDQPAHSGPELDEGARLVHFPASRFQSTIPTAAKTAAARVEGNGLGGSP